MPRASTFTSYINVEPDKAIDAKFAALEKKASGTFDRIALAANKANQRMSSGGAIGGSGNGGISGVTSSAQRAQAQALRDLAVQNQRVTTASAATTRGMNEQATAASRARREVGNLERTLRTTATTLGVVQGPLGPVAGRISAMAAAVGELTGFRLGIAGVGAGLFAIASQANKYTEVRSKLVPLYESQQDLNRAMRDTIRIAEEARLGLSPVVDLYARLTLGGRDAGLSQQRITKLTETAAKAAKLSGGAQVSQDAGLYQFAQGIGSGTLAGDELKSIRENTLRLAKAIADGMNEPIGRLKELGKEGKLTPKVIADALEKESARIDRELERLPETLGSAATKFQNSLMVMVGETDQAFGFTTALAEGLALLARNLSGVTEAALGLATAFAAYKAGSYLQGISDRAHATSLLRTETIAAAKAEVSAATDSRKAAASRVTALRSVRTEIRANITAERQARAAALSSARDAQQNARKSGMGFANPVAVREYAKAMEEVRRTNTALQGSQARLVQVNNQLGQSTNTLTTTTQRFRAAQAAAGAGAVSFGSRLKGLIAAINPLGIVLSIGIGLLIQWAFRQSEAAAAADRMAEREGNLATYIDFTTGKLIAQNAELRENARLKLLRDYTKSAEDYETVRKDLTPEAQSTSSIARFGYLPQGGNDRENAVLRKLQYGGSTIVDTRRQLTKMGASDDAFAKLDAFETAGAKLLRQRSGYRIAKGEATQADRDILGIGDGGGAAPAAAGVPKAADDRKKLAGASDKAAEAEKKLQEALDRTEKRGDILSRYDEQPKALDRAARDIRELGKLVDTEMNGIAEATKANPLGAGLYTKAMADSDAARINYGVRQPIRDLLREQQRQVELQTLVLGGHDDVAAALEKALSLQDQIGQVTEEEFQQLVANERQQRQINDALESRGRITSLILGQAQEARDIFEDLLTGGSLKDAGKQIISNIARINARKITETLFAGTDEKLRELIRGQGGVESAVEILKKNATRSSDSFGQAATAAENLRDRFNQVTKTIGTGSGSAPTAVGSGVGSLQSVTSNTSKAGLNGAGKTGGAGALSAIRKGADNFSFFGGFGGFNSSGASSSKISKIPIPANDEIVVSGTRSVQRMKGAKSSSGLPSGAETWNKIGEGFGAKVDKALGTKFMTGIGAKLGDAMQGAGTGMMASSFAKALGIKQSTTGAAVGGAIGGAAFGPIGGAVGGLIGGTIGGLFKKTKSGSATLGSDGMGGLSVASTSGNSASMKNNANSLAGGVIDQLSAIAGSLGADLSGSMGVSIGQRKKKFVVDTNGSGKTKGSGTVSFATEEEAVNFAIRNAIQDGVLGGISAASQRILASGKDLQRSLEKALIIESIPKRLMAFTDPVRAAVMNLNTEFATMIAALKEGGATAQQFADAQKLYELERAQAIEQATSQASAAIQAFLDEMAGGSSSPLNKRTVYQNAASKLDTFKGDIASGKAVDQNALLTAAQNFQEASRNLFGSGADFFSDFTSLKDLLTKARDNAGGGGNVVDLPASPFATDSVVQNAIATLNGTTATQTQVLGDYLAQILSQMKAANDVSGGSGYVGSSLNLLPGLYGGRLQNDYKLV